MSYVYKKTEPELWTVGHYEGSEWIPESDRKSPESAAERVRGLNGGNSHCAQTIGVCKDCFFAVGTNCDGIYECHRRAPEMPSQGSDDVWPPVEGNEWCGEFRPR
jgi:hypothetical protein